MKRVTVDDLVSTLRDAGLTKVEAERIVSIFVDTLKSAMVAGDELHIKGFGKFVQTYRPERMRNIFGQVRKVPELRGVKFYPFKALLEAMNPK